MFNYACGGAGGYPRFARPVEGRPSPDNAHYGRDDKLPTKTTSNVTSLTEFYGYPAELIARWCLVDKKTAERWKRGTQRPSPGHLKLFQLYRDQRVLDASWVGWRVTATHLYDPTDQGTTPGQLMAYSYVYMLAREYAPEEQVRVAYEMAQSA